MQDDDKTISLNPFQIVLAGQRQKLVFIFTGGEQEINILKKMIKKEFASDITVNSSQHVEVTVQNIIAQNHKNSTEIFDKIYNFVYKKNQSLAMQLQRIPLRSECCKNYLQFGLHNSVQYMKLEDLEKILKSVLPGSTNATVNIVMGNNCGTMGHTINVKENKQDAAKQWISENKPKNRELTTDYYLRYKSNVSTPICANLFGPLVRETGFEIKQGTEGRFWIKKE